MNRCLTDHVFSVGRTVPGEPVSNLSSLVSGLTSFPNQPESVATTNHANGANGKGREGAAWGGRWNGGRLENGARIRFCLATECDRLMWRNRR